MYLDHEPTDILPLSMSSNCLKKKTSPDRFILDFDSHVNIYQSVLASFHKTDYFKHALSLSACIDRGITGSVWRKHLPIKSLHHQTGFYSLFISLLPKPTASILLSVIIFTGRLLRHLRLLDFISPSPKCISTIPKTMSRESRTIQVGRQKTNIYIHKHLNCIKK